MRASIFAVAIGLSNQALFCRAGEPSEPDVAAWIAQLDSGKYAEREVAQRKLAGLAQAPPALRQAAESRNGEVARRAKAALADIERRQAEQRLQAALAATNEDGIDLFLMRLIHRPGYATEDRWSTLVGLIDGLAARARTCGPTSYNLAQDWMSMSVRADLPIPSVRESRVLLKDTDNSRTSISRCLCVCSGSLRRCTRLDNSILLVLGDIEGFTVIQNSFVVCTGGIGRVTSVQDSIVLARGDFAGSTGADRTLFQVSSVGRHTHAQGCTYINLAEVPGARATDNMFAQTDRGPLDALKFFEPALLGLRIRQSESGTYVESLVAQSLLERAGLRSGDELLSIGGRKWNSAASFRAALMQNAIQDSTVIHVRRGNGVLELPVKFAPSAAKK